MRVHLIAAIIQISWLVFVVYWIVAAFSVNRMRSPESPARRIFYLLLIVVSLILFDADSRYFGPLNLRFIPRSYWIAFAGALLTAAGIAFAIWARNHIGRFWSGSVAIREDHQLIRSGPYSRKIYTGILVALAGTTLAVGNYRALLAFLLILVSLIYKARLEEALLTREFGPAFDDHRRHTGFFLPRVS
ncbi:MAG: methyltransferase family protein [Candidatus Acidiferrales bacterium]